MKVFTEMRSMRYIRNHCPGPIAIAITVPLFVIGGMFSVFALGPFGIGLELICLFLLAVIVFVFYVLAATN
jgi:Mn2+/Fe2+ NRAMP family transporter